MNPYISKIQHLATPTKYTSIYSKLIERGLYRAATRLEAKENLGYVECHHIVPKCFGSDNVKAKDNLVFLTAKEHFICHECLIYMFTGLAKAKMVYALYQMKLKNKVQAQRYINARAYDSYKRPARKYVRLYLLAQVKYIDIDDTENVKLYLNNGWSHTMTEEYKVGRVGCMKGKTHSAETKVKMRSSNKHTIPPWKGIKRNPSVGKRVKETRLLKDSLEPTRRLNRIERARIKMLELHKSGIVNSKGANNPMFGHKHSEETKQKIKMKRLSLYNSVK